MSTNQFLHLPPKKSAWSDLCLTQKNLWFQIQQKDQFLSYNVPFKLKVTGEFEVSHFKTALSFLVERHTIFRAGIKQIGDQPKLFYLDKIGHETYFLCNEEFNLESLVTHSFDLANPPLFICQTVKLKMDYEIYFVFHHIILDAWSVSIIIKEIAYFYNSLLLGNLHNLARVKFDYSDYITWHESYSQTNEFKKKLLQYSEKVKNYSRIIELPYDNEKTVFLNYQCDRFHYRLSDYQNMIIDELAKRYKATPAIVFFSIFQLLLFRQSNETDLTIGMPLANRTEANFLSVVGPLVNTMLVRQLISPEESYVFHLQKTMKTIFEIFSYQTIPLENVLSEMKNQFVYHNPFNVFFNYIEIGEFQLTLDGSTISLHEIEINQGKFELALYVRNFTGSYEFSLEYLTDLFCASTVERMGHRFITLLNSIYLDPNKKINELKILSENELNELME